MVSSPQQRILVVDDQPLNVKLACSILQGPGDFLTTGVTSGEDALTSIDQDGIPDLILADVRMPGMDGFDLLARLKAMPKTEGIPFVMVTGEDSIEAEERGFHMGINDFIRKPLRAGALIARVRTLIAAHQRHEELERMANLKAEQLVHADRMATLGTLSAGAAHEINNPTTFIAGNLATLEKFWGVIEGHVSKLSDPQVDFVVAEMPRLLEGMHKGVDRIAKIVSGLKSFSRSGSKELKECDVRQIVTDAISLCNNALRRVEVVLEMDDPLPMLMGDPQRLEQVVANLLTNAADALEGRPQPRITVRTRTLMSKVLLEISDNGTGIPPEVLSRIFDPFFTTKPVGKGTGLGLSIARGIIESHQGKLNYVGRPGDGAVFRILLPVQELSNAG